MNSTCAGASAVGGGRAAAGERRRTMRSSSLREARLAGEKTTISWPNDMAKHAQNIAIENVCEAHSGSAWPWGRRAAARTLPKRRGVEICE